MGSFKTSEGERLSKTTIDGLIRKAKAEADRIAESNEMIGFCWECGIPTSRPDHSHIVSVNECQNSGKAEQAYNPDNIELLCRNCHLEYESTKKMNDRRIAYISEYFPEIIERWGIKL